MSRPAPRLELLADDAWLLSFGSDVDPGRIDPGDNARAHALADRIRRAAPAWLRDLVPAYASLAVFFDPECCPGNEIRAWLAAIDEEATAVPAAARTVEIPVAYGGHFGPDLEDAAAELGLAPAALARRHAGGDYTVAMIGFAPGFPYLSGLDAPLALPRLSTPRTRVPAGSVGIGGAQTGIYPREGPGGWRLIGRTPVRLFDPCASPPSRLLPGDQVRFRAIDAAAFERLESGRPEQAS
ncbi:5-oxoprolinase subunit PxpB [Lysobacter sp. GX 14042]|uniref:5-oxoprolinase subunit PxpB n=1 Tax=Lysobacter sp. GX 14042 TaxID=2907155 RepID=UPI001F30BBF6|nr:5-oxoprolinase subunit PxpB [Lysobacter sp. GX 14042]MCE7031622.1 5-oxoprolinase subunit PxpB [Lysobacter sp. GX 14042]